MKLSRKDYQALKLAADLADAQHLLNERNLPIAQRAAPMIGTLLGLLLLFGMGISLISSERYQAHSDQIAPIERPSTVLHIQ